MSRMHGGRGATPRPATYISTGPERTATAHVAAPCRGRDRWLAVVPVCGHCAGAHVHLAADGDQLLAGDVTRRCPVTWRVYRIGVAGALDDLVVVRR